MNRAAEAKALPREGPSALVSVRLSVKSDGTDVGSNAAALCLSACLSDCLSVCLSVHLFASLPGRLCMHLSDSHRFCIVSWYHHSAKSACMLNVYNEQNLVEAS